MNYTFKLKQPNDTKETLIYFRSYFGNENKNFIYSTGEKIKSIEWDFENRQPNDLNGRTKRAENHRSIKKQLDRYSSFFTEIVNRYKNIGEELTLDLLKQRFDEEFKKIATRNDFFRIYDEFIQEKENDYSGNSISKSTKDRYDYNKRLLEGFQKDYKLKLSLGNFNEKVYNKFLKYCIEDKDHSANTVHRNVGLLKTFLYWALDKKYTYNNSFINFKKPPKFRTDEIALNYQQVEEIYKYDFSKNKRLERVRDLFLFGCVTGMRFGNYSRISKQDIQGDFIRVIDLKSKSKNLSIPLNSISRAILEKYDYHLPSISNQKMNTFIKEVFKEMEFTEDIKKTMKYGDELIEKKSEFWERISSHTARRSFITIMKNNKVPDKVIMGYTGHTSLEVFNNYYRPSEEDKVNYMNEVFK
ncbi:tyrosine-type recombinase/integrase [Elizabethkingia anophelis]|uniref:tyrosine-type recombinase/integrase n=1 Tax=Elizabethkingia anophelis TaxID=1117645 RepID=UPI001D2828A1|nr:tyrosine-type recombinase/integrase [Elizabethkingia anophelis]EHM7982833.1 tyrosine-type recombinase/integrase [Elizabethkingia anophelis]EHM8030160.1 tyrosine-type recombinase/integrase [Elizabethkingia anophelis]EHM8034164.1 tyrosine-type recombinase/integrase [Elizabethkingia anophelis]EHZ9532914.1 tyrosine-type recombinase/integrase [Elizabethkingia anophelis]EKU3670824.1 tyrosine-type recombinase/integrase [Elizabethkingia anophelis]